MTAPDNDMMLARFAAMTDEELVRVVTVERNDYVPQALEIAEAGSAIRSLTVSGCVAIGHGS